MNPLSFGLDVPTRIGPGLDPVGRARAAEDLGFDFVSASDHPCGTNPSYETWTMLAWVAAGTSRVKVVGVQLLVSFRVRADVSVARTG